MALRDILERNRLDQVEVARGIEVSRVTVGNWVNGHTTPSGDNLVFLLAFLQQYEAGLTVTDILAPVVEPAGITGRRK